jgi:signal peptidase II
MTVHSAMNPSRPLIGTRNRRIAAIALVVLVLDQITKAIVLKYLRYTDEKDVVPGFFKLVYWGNTGAAWSVFRGNNDLLAIVALVALLILFFTRHHFDSRTWLGQLAFGFIIGGIMGNLVDRMVHKHVIDFLYFYLQQRDGRPLGFPAFNLADSAICTGVALVFLVTWKSERASNSTEITR